MEFNGVRHDVWPWVCHIANTTPLSMLVLLVLLPLLQVTRIHYELLSKNRAMCSVRL